MHQDQENKDQSRRMGLDGLSITLCFFYIFSLLPRVIKWIKFYMLYCI